nr:MAG TPA: hypothetical protein [Caudoviricetes sp.]
MSDSLVNQPLKNWYSLRNVVIATQTHCEILDHKLIYQLHIHFYLSFVNTPKIDP